MCVHYRAWASRWNRWLPRDSTEIALPWTRVPSFRNFRQGDRIEVKKPNNLWYRGQIIRVEHESGQVLLKYVSATGDPHWRGVDDCTIAPMHTHIERRATSIDSDREREEIALLARDLFPSPLTDMENDDNEHEHDDSDELDLVLLPHRRDRSASASASASAFDVGAGAGAGYVSSATEDEEMSPTLVEGEAVAATQPTQPSMALHAGDHIDCRDRSGRWLESVIAGVGFGRVLIHFKGWFEAQEYDEWVAMGSTRLQPRGTRTRDVREQASAMAGAI